MKMKNSLVFVLAGLLALALAVPAFAEEKINIYVNGKQVVSDVPPYIKSARVMVPLRFVAQAWQYSVNFAEKAEHPIQICPVLEGVNDQLKGVAGDFGYFALKPGSSNIDFISRCLEPRGSVYTTGSFYMPRAVARADVAVEERNGRVFVPLRALAEAFGSKVSWDGATRTVTIGPPDPERIVSYHGTSFGSLAEHYRQDLYPIEIYAYRVDDSQVSLACAVVAQSPFDEVLVENVPVRFWLDGKPVGLAVQKYVFNKPRTYSVGCSARVVAPWAKGERHTVRVEVDPDRDYWDRDRSNNVMEAFPDPGAGNS